ncbi:MAG: GWxTD domain-containing protein [Acidobacteriota bacterium]
MEVLKFNDRQGKRIWILGGFLLLMAGGWNPPARGAEEDSSSKSWRKGPVEYILTAKEEKQLKSLQTPEARANFVEEFWSRRDPTPGTEENEFRDRFYQRVERANKAFPNIRGGWTVDPGRVLIILGPPDDKREESNIQGILKRVEWDYGPESNAERIVTLIFLPIPDKPGVLELINERELENLLRDVPDLRGLGDKPVAPEKPMIVGIEPDPLPKGYQTEKKGPSAADRILAALMEDGTQRREIRFQVRWDFFEAADVTTHAVVSIGVLPPADLSRPSTAGDGDFEVFGTVVSSAEGVDPVNLSSEGQFIQAEERETTPIGTFQIFQARTSLLPGPYTLFAGVRNRSDGRVGTLEESFDVPDYTSQGLTLSTITLANLIQPISPGDADPDGEPFTFGNYRVVPRIEPVFGSEEDLSFYYQVYHAHPDPVTEKPRLDIEYQFLMKRGTGFKVAATVPKKNQQVEALGFSLPLKGWPATDYRLRVTVKDQVAGASVTREVDFKVR